MPTDAGFAICSPDAPHNVCASDHLRVIWVNAVSVNVYYTYYILIVKLF